MITHDPVVKVAQIRLIIIPVIFLFTKSLKFFTSYFNGLLCFKQIFIEFFNVIFLNHFFHFRRHLFLLLILIVRVFLIFRYLLLFKGLLLLRIDHNLFKLFLA